MGKSLAVEQCEHEDSLACNVADSRCAITFPSSGVGAFAQGNGVDIAL